MTRPQDSEAATATSIAAGEAKLPPALLSLIFCTILKGRTSGARPLEVDPRRLITRVRPADIEGICRRHKDFTIYK